jgi:siroheme synthase-like protein
VEASGTYYPVFLDLEGRLCVVIGGGPIAEGKITGLLEARARVVVVAPDLTPALADLDRKGRFERRDRTYRPGDLKGAFLAIAATNDRKVHERVAEEAKRRNVLLNVVDEVPFCQFIAPSIARRGNLTVAVSTGGAAPVLAVRLRQQIEKLLRPEHARFLEIAATLRQPLARRYPDFAERRELWYRLIDSDVLERLGEGDEDGAWRTIEALSGVGEALPPDLRFEDRSSAQLPDL